MFSNQDLLKKLIFLSILWATLSSGSSQWRRKGREDGTFSYPREENGAINEEYPGVKGPVSWRSFSHRLNGQHRQLNDDPSSAQIFTKSISVLGGKSKKLEIRNLISEFENVNKSLEKKTDSLYPYWKGVDENAGSLDPHQTAWQLPEQKNSTVTKNKKLKIFPISSIHDLWHATKHILMAYNDNFTNASSLDLSPVAYNNESDTQEDGRDTTGNYLASQRGDTDGESMSTGESRGWEQKGGMMKGGGQQILLIKEKGDGGGGEMPSHPGMNGKDAIGPLMMMLTPLIMMCIMMPMMMSIMGGMMNFMKGIATMMMMQTSHPMVPMMSQWPSTLSVKHRRTEEDSVSSGRVLLGSLVMEVAEKLEAALNNYDL